MRWITGLPIAALLTVGAKDPPPPVLVHSGPWDVHTSENACTLGRKFGTDKDEALVTFQPLFNAPSGEMFVMTHATGSGQRVGTATLTEEPSGRTETVSYFSKQLGKQPFRITRLVFPRTIWDGLSDTDVLSIKAPPVALRVKLVRFGAAKPVFDNCEQGILKGWHVDPVALDLRYAPRPLRSPAFFFDADDYPSEAIAAGHVGRVVAILNVDARGLVTACRIGSSSWPDLNDATCRQAKRVKFTPGQDGQGTAVPAIYLLAVRWGMFGS